jgi:hypothetical protein
VKPVKIKINAELLFVLIQMILYAIFLILDITGKNLLLSRNIKFSVILLCFCFALFQRKGADRSILCVKAGLFFTLISDLFLLMLDYYLYGVLTFIIVQQLYGIRIILADAEEGSQLTPFNKLYHTKMLRRKMIQRKASSDKKDLSVARHGDFLLYKISIRIMFQFIMAALLCFVLWLAGVYTDLLLIISVFYFICIVTNTITAVRAAKRWTDNKGLLLFALGMCLFLLCDINVGIFNMSGFIILSERAGKILYNISSILMWTFYAPSQVLISLSIKHNLQKNQ